jgi:hypothetical protein
MVVCTPLQFVRSSRLDVIGSVDGNSVFATRSRVHSSRESYI